MTRATARRPRPAARRPGGSSPGSSSSASSRRSRTRARLAGGETPDDVLYLWSTASAALIQYAIMLVLVLAIARGLAAALLGLRRPASWRRAAGSRVALVAIWVDRRRPQLFLKAGEEQGLVPEGWDSSRAAPFVANFVVVALVAPFVEELTYRGLGYAAVLTLRRARGRRSSSPALAFGLAHGLVVGLPVLTIFGVILGVAPVADRQPLPADGPARALQRRWR